MSFCRKMAPMFTDFSRNLRFLFPDFLEGQREFLQWINIFCEFFDFKQLKNSNMQESKTVSEYCVAVSALENPCHVRRQLLAFPAEANRYTVVRFDHFLTL